MFIFNINDGFMVIAWCHTSKKLQTNATVLIIWLVFTARYPSNFAHVVIGPTTSRTPSPTQAASASPPPLASPPTTMSSATFISTRWRFKLLE